MTMEDLYTKDEIDEALQCILSDKEERGIYDGAPSDLLRQYYVLGMCMSLSVWDEDFAEEQLDKPMDLSMQMQHNFTIEDWEYEAKTTADNHYRYDCQQAAAKLKAKQQAEEMTAGTGGDET